MAGTDHPIARSPDRPMLRIAYLLESTEVSGGVKVVLQQAEALARRGHRVAGRVSPGAQPGWFPLSRARFERSSFRESRELAAGRRPDRHVLDDGGARPSTARAARSFICARATRAPSASTPISARRSRPRTGCRRASSRSRRRSPRGSTASVSVRPKTSGSPSTRATSSRAPEARTPAAAPAVLMVGPVRSGREGNRASVSRVSGSGASAGESSGCGASRPSRSRQTRKRPRCPTSTTTTSRRGGCPSPIAPPTSSSGRTGPKRGSDCRCSRRSPPACRASSPIRPATGRSRERRPGTFPTEIPRASRRLSRASRRGKRARGPAIEGPRAASRFDTARVAASLEAAFERALAGGGPDGPRTPRRAERIPPHDAGGLRGRRQPPQRGGGGAVRSPRSRTPSRGRGSRGRSCSWIADRGGGSGPPARQSPPTGACCFRKTADTRAASMPASLVREEPGSFSPTPTSSSPTGSVGRLLERDRGASRRRRGAPVDLGLGGPLAASSRLRSRPLPRRRAAPVRALPGARPAALRVLCARDAAALGARRPRASSLRRRSRGAARRLRRRGPLRRAVPVRVRGDGVGGPGPFGGIRPALCPGGPRAPSLGGELFPKSGDRRAPGRFRETLPAPALRSGRTGAARQRRAAARARRPWPTLRAPLRRPRGRRVALSPNPSGFPFAVSRPVPRFRPARRCPVRPGSRSLVRDVFGRRTAGPSNGPPGNIRRELRDPRGDGAGRAGHPAALRARLRRPVVRARNGNGSSRATRTAGSGPSRSSAERSSATMPGGPCASGSTGRRGWSIPSATSRRIRPCAAFGRATASTDRWRTRSTNGRVPRRAVLLRVSDARALEISNRLAGTRTLFPIRERHVSCEYVSSGAAGRGCGRFRGARPSIPSGPPLRAFGACRGARPREGELEVPRAAEPLLPDGLAGGGRRLRGWAALSVVGEQAIVADFLSELPDGSDLPPLFAAAAAEASAAGRAAPGLLGNAGRSGRRGDREARRRVREAGYPVDRARLRRALSRSGSRGRRTSRRPSTTSSER